MCYKLTLIVERVYFVLVLLIFYGVVVGWMILVKLTFKKCKNLFQWQKE